MIKKEKRYLQEKVKEERNKYVVAFLSVRNKYAVALEKLKD